MQSESQATGEQNIVLLRDSDWSIIDSSISRVLDFVPMGTMKDRKVIALNRATPYASIIIENKKFPRKASGFITNKLDFKHLWLAFKERGVKDDEEVNVIWTKKHYKNFIYKMLSPGMPRL